MCQTRINLQTATFGGLVHRYPELQEDLSTQLLYQSMVDAIYDEKKQLHEEAHRDATTEFRYMLVTFENTTLPALSTEDNELREHM